MEKQSRGAIFIMGVSGAGKSFFVNRLVEEAVREGHTLSSETQVCQPVEIVFDEDEAITVVDTPGFDDTERSQIQIFSKITDYLSYQRESGIPLRGILYLHRITDNKLTKSSKNSLEVLKDMVGHKAMTNVILVTTMWNLVHPDEMKHANNREQELIENYWKPMVDEGSYVTRFDGSRESAEALIFRLSEQRPMVLDIQEQILDERRNLIDTTAGQGLVYQLIEDRRKYEASIMDIKRQLKKETELQPRNKTKIRELKDRQGRLEELVRLLGKEEELEGRPAGRIQDRVRQALSVSGGKAAQAFALVLQTTLFVINTVAAFQ